MDLILVRHAPAGSRQAWLDEGKKDSIRPLTPEGRRRMDCAVEGLKTLLPRIDLIVTSPLVRAVQTADILAEAYPEAERFELPHLAPGGDPDGVLDWLKPRSKTEVAALVGHEPGLGDLLCKLLANNRESFVELKKGACAFVEFGGVPRMGHGMLRWLLQPKALRGLA